MKNRKIIKYARAGKESYQPRSVVYNTENTVFSDGHSDAFIGEQTYYPAALSVYEKGNGISGV